MELNDFKPVTKNGKIIGFIHLRQDGAYEATTTRQTGRRQERWTTTDALDTEYEARNYIKTTYNS